MTVVGGGQGCGGLRVPPGSLVPLTQVQFTLQVGLLQRQERAAGSGSPGPATLRANRLSREHSHVFQSFE